MASYTTIAIVKLMTLWNYICMLYSNTKTSCKNMYSYIYDYFHGSHDVWVFIPGHTIPVSLSNLENTARVNWVYNNNNNTLTFSTDKITETSISKISWLSAKIKIINKYDTDEIFTYEIDDFIEKFKVCTLTTIPPALYMVFLCWCAYSKNWFSHSSIVEFHIIDDMGDEHILSFKEHLANFTIKRNKLYITLDDKEENISNEIVSTEESPLKEEDEKKYE